MPPNGARCGECVHFFELDAKAGACRRYPPRVRDVGEAGVWPVVMAFGDDWCGEFRALPPPPVVEPGFVATGKWKCAPPNPLDYRARYQAEFKSRDGRVEWREIDSPPRPPGTK